MKVIRRQRDSFSHQRCLGLLPGSVAPLISGFGRMPRQVLLYATLVLRTAADIAVVWVVRNDLILPVHR